MARYLLIILIIGVSRNVYGQTIKLKDMENLRSQDNMQKMSLADPVTRHRMLETRMTDPWSQDNMQKMPLADPVTRHRMLETRMTDPWSQGNMQMMHLADPVTRQRMPQSQDNMQKMPLADPVTRHRMLETRMTDPQSQEDMQKMPLAIPRTRDTMNTMDTMDTMDTMNTMDTMDTMDTMHTMDTMDTEYQPTQAILKGQSAICMPENVTVSLKLPNELPNEPGFLRYFPTCMRLQRCGGCCSGSTLECVPTVVTSVNIEVIGIKKKVVQRRLRSRQGRRSRRPTFDHNVYLVPEQQHLECRCQCRVQAEHCNLQKQDYDPKTCSCKCKIEMNFMSMCNSTTYWDINECRCASAL